MNLSYTDMHDMQEKAMERVLDMQKRAKYTAEIANAELRGSSSSKPSKAVEYTPALKENNAKQHHIRMPLNLPNETPEYPNFKRYFNDESTKTRQNIDKQHKANLLDEILREPDRAMLFSLLLLLKSEGADEALLMSLLYIMS